MSIFPVLSSLTEILGNTITDDFKKLIRPGPLVAAAIFLALNQVLILPILREHNVAAILAFESLSTTWQVVLGTFILFVLSYLLNAAGSVMVNLASGQIIRDTWLGRRGLTRQERLYDALLSQLKNYAETGEAESEAARATQRLAADFPERAALAPTQLGNILANPASYTWNQYGVHLDTIWPAMEATLAADNAKLQENIAARMDTLIFLSGLVGVFGLVGLEILIAKLWWGPLWHVLWLPVLAVFAYAAYQTTVPQARAWARDMRLAFDLHLDAAAGKLKLRALDSHDDLQKDEKTKKNKQMARWENVSRWLLYGALQLPADQEWTKQLTIPERQADWYKEKPAAAVPADITLTHPPTVSVKAEQQRLNSWELQGNRTAHLTACRLSYLFAITNEDSGEHALPAQNVFLLVRDKCAPALPAVVPGVLNQSSRVRGRRQPGTPESLLWPLGDIPPRATVWLRYELAYDPRLEVVVTNAAIQEVQSIGEAHVKLLLRSHAASDITLVVTRLNEKQKLPANIFPTVAHAGPELTVTPVPAASPSQTGWLIAGAPAGSVIHCVLHSVKVEDQEL